MKSKEIYNTISKLLLMSILFLGSCSKQPYYHIPVDENGKAIITQVTKVSSTGITVSDDSFTVNVEFATAKPLDKIVVEVLKLQEVNGVEKLLPLPGTQKEFVLDESLKVSVVYTKEEAMLKEVSDYVVVTFAGKNDSATIEIVLEAE